jgi:hypothetical protein
MGCPVLTLLGREARVSTITDNGHFPRTDYGNAAQSPQVSANRTVARGLVARPEDWKWSSYRHYLTGVEGTVEIESEWTARRREQMGIRPRIKAGPVQCFPP